MQLPFTINWGKLLLGALPVLALGAVLWSIYSIGSGNGAAGVQAQWDKARLKEQAQIEKLERMIAIKEATHRQQSTRISYVLSTANENYARSVAVLDNELSLRLRDSEGRAARYRAMSESGATQSANLASHAAQLDRSLEEGRRLVKEFRATLEQRDAQLNALGQQILTDRALIGGIDGLEATSAE